MVLSFWASWCGPCMQMVPSEIKLTERMKGKPFALVGVNGDAVKGDAKRAVGKENISWPSFWSKEGSDGPVPTIWNIQGWPTVYVIDQNGVIRFKSEGADMNLINQKVDQLVVQVADKNHSRCLRPESPNKIAAGNPDWRWQFRYRGRSVVVPGV